MVMTRSTKGWFDQWRARGVCYICRRPMEDDDPRRAHTECMQLSGGSSPRSWAAIRADPPAVRPWREVLATMRGDHAARLLERSRELADG